MLRAEGENTRLVDNRLLSLATDFIKAPANQDIKKDILLEGKNLETSDNEEPADPNED